METGIVPGIFGVARLFPTGVQPLGTAFSIGEDIFATTYHVTSGDPTNLVLVVPKVTGTEFADYQDTSDPEVKSIAATIAEADPIRDIALLKFKGGGAPNYPLAGSDVVLPGNPVTAVGFPHFDQGRFVLTRHDTHVGARVLITNEGIKTKHIVLNVQSRPGQSGSPVFFEGFSRVVAMIIGSYAPGGGGGVIVAGVDPLTLHQTTHAISAEYISAMQ